MTDFWFHVLMSTAVILAGVVSVVASFAATIWALSAAFRVIDRRERRTP